MARRARPEPCRPDPARNEHYVRKSEPEPDPQHESPLFVRVFRGLILRYRKLHRTIQSGFYESILLQFQRISASESRHTSTGV